MALATFVVHEPMREVGSIPSASAKQRQSHAAAAFPGVPFRTVRAFRFDQRAKLGDPDWCGGPLLFNGADDLTRATNCPSLEMPGTLLSAAQVQRLLAAVNNAATYARRSGPCWEPHQGFIFYNAKDKAVAFVTICFECNRLEGFPEIPAQRSSHFFSVDGTTAMSELMDELLPD